MACGIQFPNASIAGIIQFYNSNMVDRFWFQNANIANDNFNYFYKTIEKMVVLTIPLTRLIATTVCKGDTHITHHINDSFTLEFEIFNWVIFYFGIWNSNTSKTN